MKRFAFIGLTSALLAGCGAETDVLNPLPVAPEADLCTYCELEPEEEIWFEPPPPAPQIEATPTELGFFGSIDSEAVRSTRTVTITNGTSSWVQVTRVYVVDAESLAVGGGDAMYFDVEEPDLDEPLGHGDSLELLVSFVMSSHQRSALLVVETTHPAHKSLVVSLSGKIFVGW